MSHPGRRPRRIARPKKGGGGADPMVVDPRPELGESSADDDSASANEEEIAMYAMRRQSKKKVQGDDTKLVADGRAARVELARRLEEGVMKPLRERNDKDVFGVEAVDEPEVNLYPSELYKRMQCTMAFVHHLASVTPVSVLGKGDGFQAAMDGACVWSYLPPAQRVPLTLLEAVRHWQLRFAITFTAAIVLRSGHVLLVFEWLDDGRAVTGFGGGGGADMTIVVVFKLATEGPATAALLDTVFKASPADAPCELFPRAYLIQEDEVLTMAGTGSARVHDFGPTACSLPAAEALVNQARLFYMNYAYVGDELLTLASHLWS